MDNAFLPLWIDISNNTAYAGWQSLTPYKTIILKQGDKVDLELHLVKKSSFDGNVVEEVPFSGSENIKVAIGNIEERPNFGYFTLTYIGDTAKILVSDTASQVQTKLNQLNSISSVGGVTVSILDSLYRVSFNQAGIRNSFSINASNLIPLSTCSINRVIVGDSNKNDVQDFRLKCSPVAYTETSIDTPESVASIIAGQQGNWIVSIKPNPKSGTFKISDGTNTTEPIAIGSNHIEFKNKLTSSGIDNATETFEVSKIGIYTWAIKQTGGQIKNLTIDSSVVSFSSKSLLLNLNTVELETLLSNEQSVKTKIEIEIFDSGKKQTIYQGELIILNDLIDNSTYDPILISSPASQAELDALTARVNSLESNSFPTNIQNPTNDDVLFYNQNAGKWVNKKIEFTRINGGIF